MEPRPGRAFEDPLVGRDLLLGILVGVVHRLLTQLSQRAPAWLGRRRASRCRFRASTAACVSTLSAILSSSAVAVLIATTLVLIFFLLFLVLRRRVLAIGAFGVLLVAATLPDAAGRWRWRSCWPASSSRP